MLGIITSIEHLTQELVTYWFTPEKPIRYSAGQFTELSLAEAEMLQPLTHEFTLSSSPTEQNLAITTRFKPPLSKFKQRLQSIQVGDTIQFTVPMGDFVLPRDTSIPLLFIAAGIGITPFRSMTQQLIESNEQRVIHTIYITSNPQDQIFTETLAAVSSMTYLVTDKQSNTMTQIVDTVRSITPIDNQLLYVYISGPETLVTAIRKSLSTVLSITTDHIITDYFSGYTSLA